MILFIVISGLVLLGTDLEILFFSLLGKAFLFSVALCPT